MSRVCKIICVNHHRLFDTPAFCIMDSGFDNTVISWKKLVENFSGGGNDVAGIY
jgi:predicted restriction endonuclease